jgi:alpha-amylase
MKNRYTISDFRQPTKKLGALLCVVLWLGASLIANTVYCASDSTQTSSDWRGQIIYLVMTDRFYDGDTANNRAGHADAYDPSHPRFCHGGDFAGLEKQIPYLKALGITSLWMTPVYRQVGLCQGNLHGKMAGYHGYWPDFKIPDDGAIEPKLGTEKDLSRLIQGLHNQQNKMKVIFDMVVNHSGYEATITHQKPDWFSKNGDCNIEDDPVNCPLAGLPDFKHGMGEVRTYLTDLSTQWIRKFPVDGVRLDTAKHVPLHYLEEWVGALRSERPDIFLIAEVMLDGNVDSLKQLKPYFDIGFDSAFNFPLRHTLVDTIAKGGSVDILAHTVDQTMKLFTMERALYVVNLLDNHDLPRFINEPGFGVPEEDIVKRYQMALGLIFTLPGIPQVYYGGELGMYGGDDPDNRFDMPQWAWSEEDRAHGRDQARLSPPRFLPDPNETFLLTKKLIGIRRASKPLCFGNYAELWRQNGPSNPNVYAFIRVLDVDGVIVVLNNGSQSSGLLKIPVQENPNVPENLKKRLIDGAKLVDVLDLGAPRHITVNQGSCELDLSGKTIGAYMIEKPLISVK